MPGPVARQRAESALRFLLQKTDQLEAFHVGNFLITVRDFLGLLERDDALHYVAQALRRRVGRTAKEWADETVAKNAVPPLPAEPIACLAFRHDALRAVAMEKIDLRYFVSSFYPGAHLNEKLMNWKRAIVHPLAADLRRLVAILLEKLPSDERIDMDALVEEGLEALAPVAFGARSWTDQDDEAPRDAPPKATPKPGKSEAPRATPKKSEAPPEGAPKPKKGAASFDEALAGLEKAIESAALSPDERADLAIDVKILALESKKRGKNGGERIRARLGALAGRKPLAAAVRRVLEALGPR